jgi:hypothetical protein
MLIYADTVLSPPIVFQGFKSIAGRNFQIVKNSRPGQLCKLAKGRALDVHPTLHSPAFKEGLSVLALEAFDRHGQR